MAAPVADRSGGVRRAVRTLAVPPRALRCHSPRSCATAARCTRHCPVKVTSPTLAITPLGQRGGPLVGPPSSEISVTGVDDRAVDGAGRRARSPHPPMTATIASSSAASPSRTRPSREEGAALDVEREHDQVRVAEPAPELGGAGGGLPSAGEVAHDHRLLERRGEQQVRPRDAAPRRARPRPGQPVASQPSAWPKSPPLMSWKHSQNADRTAAGTSPSSMCSW